MRRKGAGRAGERAVRAVAAGTLPNEVDWFRSPVGRGGVTNPGGAQRNLQPTP